MQNNIGKDFTNKKLKDNIQNTEKLNQHSIEDPDNVLSKMNYEKLNRYHEDTINRSKLSGWTLLIIAFWLVCTVIILFFFNSKCFYLFDIVLCTLLGTTMINVLGLAVIILNGYFKYMNQNVDLKNLYSDKH